MSLLEIQLEESCQLFISMHFQLIPSNAPTSTLRCQWPRNPLTWPLLHSQSQPHGFPFLVTPPDPSHYTIIMPLRLSPVHLGLFLLPCSSVGKATTLIKYNYPWILSLSQRNWHNPEKINNYTGWFCFKDQTLLSKGFQPYLMTLPHFPDHLTLLLLENYFILFYLFLTLIWWPDSYFS